MSEPESEAEVALFADHQYHPTCYCWKCAKHRNSDAHYHKDKNCVCKTCRELPARERAIFQTYGFKALEEYRLFCLIEKSSLWSRLWAWWKDRPQRCYRACVDGTWNYYPSLARARQEVEEYLKDYDGDPAEFEPEFAGWWRSSELDLLPDLG